MTNASEPACITTSADLQELCAQLADVPWLALDTEFLREKTYYPQLCLLQVAVPDRVACIDPLVLDDIEPLLDLLYDRRITKVMHAARQDLEILFHLRGAPPAPVFDTQVAALLLGFPDQVGYGTLVSGLLGVKLDKLHTRADWSRRPLTPEQLRYAADDVRYLAQVYEILLERLQELGRLAWLADDFERMVQPELYRNSPQQAWLKVRGANRLRGAALAVLQALAAWRETLAQELDRPRGWLLRDDVLVDIARQQPRTRADLGRLRGVSERLVERHGEHLLELIGAARERTPEPLPGGGRRARLTPSQEALLDVMSAVVRLCAAENSLNPAVLASRRQLEQLLVDPGTSELMQGWHRRLVGERLQALLDGELALRVAAGEIVLTGS